ncbi:chalcone isomerase family protein [Halopseudomonas maritima]|uniref:chalcone isomerase family protein n=1 Tax=Halopseudomonas maritima TaxID=2918528 RepID=UPI001EECD031|nr:chalcone isomerase family protein [Halopseudomonas maritima]UJJ31250.1 chalcone isomerase family protein [Halopseudomonas maritima]
MHPIIRTFLLGALLVSPIIHSADNALTLRNQHLFRYLLMDIYTAELYAPAQAPLEQLLASDQAARLTLRYHRNIARKDLIKAAQTTLRRQHGENDLSLWQAELDTLHSRFSDIKDGDSYSLERSAEGTLTLRHNGTLSYQSDTPGLATLYLGIWLGEDGLSDSLRSALLQ